MSQATTTLVITDERDDSTASQKVCITTPDGTVMKQAANVATTGTVEDIVNALIAAGLMAPAAS